MTAEKYVARLCWNTNGWKGPTADATATENPDTYAAAMGFGAEEWLFNFEWMLRGWKYGYLAPVMKSLAKVQGTAMDIRLYTIAPGGKWFYVGHLHHCEAVSNGESLRVFAEFKKRGWFQDMVEQARAIGGNVSELEAVGPHLFNVRFKPADTEIYTRPILVPATDAVRRLRRYLLVKRTNVPDVDREWSSRVAATHVAAAVTTTRVGTPSTEVSAVERQLQNALHRRLVKQYGASSVIIEDGFVDLKVRRGKTSTLFEVKADERPRYAIRQALGQLLEYGFVCVRKGERVDKYVVAAPGRLGARDQEYLDYLRGQLSLPIEYVRVAISKGQLRV